MIKYVTRRYQCAILSDAIAIRLSIRQDNHVWSWLWQVGPYTSMLALRQSFEAVTASINDIFRILISAETMVDTVATRDGSDTYQ